MRDRIPGSSVGSYALYRGGSVSRAIPRSGGALSGKRCPKKSGSSMPRKPCVVLAWTQKTKRTTNSPSRGEPRMKFGTRSLQHGGLPALAGLRSIGCHKSGLRGEITLCAISAGDSIPIGAALFSLPLHGRVNKQPHFTEVTRYEEMRKTNVRT